MEATRLIVPTEPDLHTLEGFIIPEGRRDVVLSFLQQKPALAAILAALPEQVPHYFPNATVVLEPASDDAWRNWTYLVVEIRTDLTVDEVLAQQEAFEEAWWDERALPLFVCLRLLVRARATD